MTEPITKEERAKYPWYDLEGALDDLKAQDADKVCLNTIERAIDRLCGYEAALQAAEALLREAVMALAPNVRLTARIALAQRIAHFIDAAQPLNPWKDANTHLGDKS